jgi:centromere/kinetochore protein ZW10
VPTLVNRLSAHSGLAQALADADVIFECLAHLQRCRSTFQSLESSVDFGELPDAVATGRELEELLSNAPTVLTKASVMTDLKVHYMWSRDHGSH